MKILINVLTSLFLVSMFISPTSAQQEDFLVGYWAFDEGKGNDVKDSSGKGNDGKINGKVNWVDGQFGKALEFTPGANVAIPDSDSLRDMKELTIALWINFNSFAPAWNHILEKDGSYGLTVNTGTGDFRFSPNSSKVWVESKFKVSEKKWYYITMTWDGSIVLFYVNGKKQSETKEPVVFNNNLVNIAHGAPYTIDGIIDEVKFWAKALTDDEINIAMTGNLAVKPSKEKLVTTWAQIKK